MRPLRRCRKPYLNIGTLCARLQRIFDAMHYTHVHAYESNSSIRRTIVRKTQCSARGAHLSHFGCPAKMTTTTAAKAAAAAACSMQNTRRLHGRANVQVARDLSHISGVRSSRGVWLSVSDEVGCWMRGVQKSRDEMMCG